MSLVPDHCVWKREREIEPRIMVVMMRAYLQGGDDEYAHQSKDKNG
jgi:hypothetical protein